MLAPQRNRGTCNRNTLATVDLLLPKQVITLES